MPRKKAVKKKNTEEKIIRNYDPFSMEKRIYNLDQAPQRSYDLYSMEKRIYDLEINGGGGKSLLKGYTIPTLETGKNGDIYAQCVIMGVDLSTFTISKEASMTVTATKTDIKAVYESGSSIGAKASLAIDFTNVNEMAFEISSKNRAYDNYATPRFCPFLFLSDTDRYAVDDDASSTLGAMSKISANNTTKTGVLDCTEITGTKYLIFNCSGVSCDLVKIVLDGVTVDIVSNAYIKQSDTWNELIGAQV